MSRAPDWKKLRDQYESGETVTRLAQIHNVKAWKIRERAELDHWGPNAGEEALRDEQARKAEQRKRQLVAAGALGAMSDEQRTALVQQLLERYLQGETPYQLGKEVGVSRDYLYCALFGLADDDLHRDLISQALIVRVCRADAALEAATSPAEIGRAREQAKFARMDLERRRPSLYGSQQRHEHVIESADWGEQLRRARARTIDGEVMPLPLLGSATESSS